MKLPRVFLMLVLWVLIPGCRFVQIFEPIAQGLKDEFDASVADVSNEFCSEIAWRRWNDMFKDQPYQHDFATGFRSAYVDMINGGSGEPPVLPPRGYWRHCYRSARGRERANAWFLGYRFGAISAEQDGAGNWYELPINLHPEDLPEDERALYSDPIIIENTSEPVPGPRLLEQYPSPAEENIHIIPSPEMVYPEAGDPESDASDEEPPLPELIPKNPDLGRVPFGTSEPGKEP